MAFSRQFLLTARFAALAGMITLRGRRRMLAWAAHDFLWLYPTLRRNCPWHGEVITRFATMEREIWLTIDDGPDPRDTPGILDLLARHRATATFFVIGKKVDAHRALTRRILAAGHSLGSHTYSHPAALWWLLPRPLVRREISRASHALRAATGSAPHWFRSPVGMSGTAVHPCARAAGLRVIGWSSAGLDGCPGASPSAVVDRLMRGVRPGAILLLHESGSSPHRVETLSRLLDRLDGAGYRCILPKEENFR